MANYSDRIPRLYRFTAHKRIIRVETEPLELYSETPMAFLELTRYRTIFGFGWDIFFNINIFVDPPTMSSI